MWCNERWRSMHWDKESDNQLNEMWQWNTMWWDVMMRPYAKWQQDTMMRCTRGCNRSWQWDTAMGCNDKMQHSNVTTNQTKQQAWQEAKMQCNNERRGEKTSWRDKTRQEETGNMICDKMRHDVMQQWEVIMTRQDGTWCGNATGHDNKWQSNNATTNKTIGHNKRQRRNERQRHSRGKWQMIIFMVGKDNTTQGKKGSMYQPT